MRSVSAIRADVPAAAEPLGALVVTLVILWGIWRLCGHQSTTVPASSTRPTADSSVGVVNGVIDSDAPTAEFDATDVLDHDTNTGPVVGRAIDGPVVTLGPPYLCDGMTARRRSQ